MRKIFFTLAVLLALSGPAFGAGSCAVSYSQPSIGVTVVTFSWTGDSSNGSVPATASGNLNGFVFMIVTDPGTPSPTDDYDITLVDGDGEDILGAGGENRDTANTESLRPEIGGTAVDSRFVDGGLTLNLSNNSVNSAIGEVKIYVRGAP